MCVKLYLFILFLADNSCGGNISTSFPEQVCKYFYLNAVAYKGVLYCMELRLCTLTYSECWVLCPTICLDVGAHVYSHED